MKERNQFNYNARIRLLVFAYMEGYDIHRVNPWSYVFKRTTEQNGAITFNLYWNRKNNYFTCITAMDHPKQGKTNMTRRFVSEKTAEQLLINPRKHTGKGYKKRKR